MVLQFEGVIDNISGPQLAFIRNVLEQRGYRDTKVIVEAVGQAGDNYVANVKRIIVRNEHGEFRMIAKIAPQIESLRIATKSQELFRNEHIMYTLVLPKFQELEEQVDLFKKDRLRFAECYGSFPNAPHEVLLLEDLQVQGFVMLDRFTPLFEEYIKSVLRNFAILHSLSFALRHKEPETFKEFRNNLYDTWGSAHNNPNVLYYFSHIENTAAITVEGDYRKKHVKGCISETISLCEKNAKQNAGSKYSVIQQGDTWTNNILFKFNGGSLEQSVLIDYQVSKVNNPTHDLMYMIFTCSDHEARLKHFIHWIDYYHSELDKALHHHGLKASYVYPRDQLDADMKRYAKLMLGLLVLMTSVSLLTPSDAARMKDASEHFGQYNDGQANESLLKELTAFEDDFTLAFKERVEGIVDSFVNFGLL